MSVDFFTSVYQRTSNKKRFGLCDNPPPPHTPAYLDETDGRKWIAVVENEFLYEVLFVPIDNNIELRKANGHKDKCCDALLAYDATIIFVELKQRVGKKSKDWITDGYEQLRKTIKHFENTEASANFSVKKSYIANSEQPKFRKGQMERMDNFLKDTGYVLRIENRIILE
jgi:hypothetical protein